MVRNRKVLVCCRPPHRSVYPDSAMRPKFSGCSQASFGKYYLAIVVFGLDDTDHKGFIGVVKIGCSPTGFDSGPYPYMISFLKFR